jgi:hypothetical protein
MSDMSFPFMVGVVSCGLTAASSGLPRHLIGQSVGLNRDADQLHLIGLRQGLLSCGQRGGSSGPLLQHVFGILVEVVEVV